MYQTEPKDAKHYDCLACGDPLPARVGASTLLCARCQRRYVLPLDSDGKDGPHDNRMPPTRFAVGRGKAGR